MKKFHIFLWTLSILFLTKPSFSQEWIPQHIVSAEYPPLAYQARIKGTIEIECEISSDGSVISAKVKSPKTKSNGHPLLEKAALKSIEKWKFRKSLENESSSTHNYTVIYEFILEGTSMGRPQQEFTFDFPNKVTVKSEAPHWQPSS